MIQGAFLYQVLSSNYNYLWASKELRFSRVPFRWILHVTYALSTWVYLHILIVLFRIVPGFFSRLLRVPLGLTLILGGTLRCHDTWLFAFAFGRVLFDITKYQGLTPQGCQVSMTRTFGGLTSFCMFESWHAKCEPLYLLRLFYVKCPSCQTFSHLFKLAVPARIFSLSAFCSWL